MAFLFFIAFVVIGGGISLFITETKIGQRIGHFGIWVICILMMLGMVIAFFQAIIHYVSVAIHFIGGLFG